jgi:hypothetical protein
MLAPRSRKSVERVRVTASGGDRAFGAYLPRGPLERLGAKPGDTLTVNVSWRRMVLAVEGEEKPAGVLLEPPSARKFMMRALAESGDG